MLLGAVVGAGIGYIFNTYVLKKSGFDPKPNSVEPTTKADLSPKVGGSTEISVDSKGLKDFPGFADNEFCVFESHEASIEGIPLINQRSFINNFYSWIESSNLTEDSNWVQLYQLLGMDKEKNEAVILELEEKFGALLDGFIEIQHNGKNVSDEKTIQIFFNLIQEDIELMLNSILLNQNSINIYFTLFYFIFLIFSLGNKHFVFDWIKIKFLLKFYRLFLFFKS